jgi:hypothetical protein
MDNPERRAEQPPCPGSGKPPCPTPAPRAAVAHCAWCGRQVYYIRGLEGYVTYRHLQLDPEKSWTKAGA